MIKQLRTKMIWEGWLPLKSKAGNGCIVMYHGVDQREETRFNPRFFSQKTFESHLRFFKKKYNILSLEDFFAKNNWSKSKLNLCITFDDGYLNNFRYAAPILEREQIPATMFITGMNEVNEPILWPDLIDITSYFSSLEKIEFEGIEYKRDSTGCFAELRRHISLSTVVGSPRFESLKKTLLASSSFSLSDSSMYDYWKLMSDEQIKALANFNYVKIGSHGYCHNGLGAIGTAEAITEMKMAKAYLENLTQYEIDAIAYPYGSYTMEVAEAALEMGLAYQCVVNFNNVTDSESPYLRKRLGLYPTTSIPQMNYDIHAFAQ